LEIIMTQRALSIRFKAQAGRPTDIGIFLTRALDLANQDGGTPVWFGLQYNDRDFGIFTVFASDAEMQAYLAGPIHAATMAQTDYMFEAEPTVEKIYVLDTKNNPI
jgi:hypothetical protein